MNGANYAAFNVDAAEGLEFTDFGARGRSSGSSSLENQTVYRGPQNEGYKPSAAPRSPHVLPVGPYNPSRATAHGQSQQQHSFLQMDAAGMSVDDYLRQDQLLNSFLGAAAPSFGQHSANRVSQYQQHTSATNTSGPFDPIPMQQMTRGNSNRGHCVEDFLSSHLQMHLTSAAASVDHSGGGSNYISGSSSDQFHEPWLEEIKVEVASLSLKPLSGVEIITRLQKRMDDVIRKFLPCVHFLVECHQDLRKGLVEAQRRVGSGRQYLQRQRMTPKQFYQTYVDPLPVKFMMKNEHVMDRTALNEAVTGLENLRKEAKVSSETSCEAVKNTFLGGMKEGESWGLCKWLSRHGNTLAVCTDLECILKACKALDKNMESTKKLAKLLIPIASQTLTRLKTKVPASYQERSSAHPYLPFFHRLESALRDVSQFDPDDDGIILLDDSDDEDDVVVEIVKKPSPEPKTKAPTKSRAKRKAYDPPPAKAQVVKPIQIQATILPLPEDDRSKPEGQVPSALFSSDMQILLTSQRVGLAAEAAPTKRPTFTDEDLRSLLDSDYTQPTNADSAVTTKPNQAKAFPIPIPPPPQPQKQTPPSQPQQQQQQGDPFSSPGFLQRTDYEDPIMNWIMADPVSCQDGHTYDRPVIERCFDDRIKAEQERQRREAGEQNCQVEDEENDGAVCCGSRAPIELLSPVTNKVVSGILVPNFILEQQIVRLMAVNAFQMDPEEIADWKTRRQEKKERDQQREREEQLERERIDQMRINAQEAIQRNRLREQQERAPQPIDPCEQVRLDPSVSSGLAVAIAGEGTQVTKESILGLGLPLRCMVDRCAKRLEEGDKDNHHTRCNYDWCARCARLVCHDCLGFEASDFASTGDGTKKHEICVDCVSQLVDVMEASSDVSLKQHHVLLLRSFDEHTARFSNQLATIQERVVRFHANNRYSPQLINMECGIRRLEEELAVLSQKAEQAASRAAAAQADCFASLETNESRIPSRIDTAAPIGRLTAECEEIELELSVIKESPPSDDDDDAEIMKYFEKLTALTDRLDDARTRLAIAASSGEAESPFDENNEEIIAEQEEHQPAGEEITALQQEVEQLDNRLKDLSVRVSEEGDIEHALELSRVQAELEEANLRYGMALSMKMTKPRTNPQARAEAPSKAGDKRSRTISLQCTEIFANRAQTRLDAQRQKKWFRGSKKQGAKNELAQSWMDSVTGLITEIPYASSYSERIAKADELSALLPLASEHLNNLLGDALGMSAALAELERIIADAKRKKELRGSKRPGSAGRGIFSDALAGLLPVPVPAAQTCVEAFEHFESKIVGESGPLEPKIIDSAATIVKLVSDLDAIGFHYDRWPLPHNLKYPTPRMVRQLEVLRNTLKLRKVESERVVEEEWTERFQRLTTHTEQLEDDKAKAQRAAASAESNAKDEERRQRERAELRRKREEERLERERELREKAEQAERERQELDRRHREEEAATLAAFSNLVGENNRGAAAFGGTGDLRMCKRCKAGPIENQACSDLRSHNDAATTYKGNAVFAKKNPNHCPRCGWFDADWQKWPYWDGIYGPH